MEDQIIPDRKHKFVAIVEIYNDDFISLWSLIVSPETYIGSFKPCLFQKSEHIWLTLKKTLFLEKKN